MTRIFNIISWLGIALVLAAVGIRFGAPAQEKYATYLAWAGLVCIVLYILSQWREIARFFGTRSGRYGTLAASSLVIVLGILVAMNYIGKRQNKRWDFTASGQFSLSDQSRNVLQKLDSPLHVQIFAQEQDFQKYRDRFKEYEYVSKQISTEYIDPDKKPAIAQQNNAGYDTMLFTYKGRTERTTINAEQEITNAIIKAVSGQVKKVYFTQGHGEHDPTSTERDGYQSITQALTNENYGVEKVVLTQTSKVPDDASAVVIAGPRTDFFAPEVDALKKYLENNGKLLLMLDPTEAASATPLTNLIGLAHDWGIDVTNTLVVDASGMGRLIGAGPEMPIAANYPDHPITARFQIATAYPLARALTIVTGGVNGHIALPVVESSPQSWAEADLKSIGEGKEVSLDESKGDKPGPVTIAAAVNASTAPATPPVPGQPEAPRPETRVVVFGDSDFPSNSVLGIPGNKDLFMNTIGWLSQQENLISIRPKAAEDRRLTLTATQQNNVTWLSLLVVPGAVFGTGIYTWWRRR